MGSLLESPFNKCLVDALIGEMGYCPVMLSLAGRGGEGRKQSRRSFPASPSMVYQHLLQNRAQHMVDSSVAMICGQGEGHPSRCQDSAPSTSKMEALSRDPCRHYTPTSCQVVHPQQMVAGGRHRRLIAGGEDAGLDRFSYFHPGSFLIVFRTAFQFYFSQGPGCKMYPPLQN